MVEIMTRNGVSLQVLQTTAASIATGTINTQDLTLDRAGKFLGCTAAFFENAASIGAANDWQVAITDTSDNQIAYGQEISQIRVKVRNDSGGNRTLAVYLNVWIGVSN